MANQDRVANANATASATMFDEWVRAGVRTVVVSPGSRSTPLALAAARLADLGAVDLYVQLDERSAAFMALGIGAATGVPAVLVCTSGTAAANYAPAVIEAGLSNIAMIVATADRPPELRGRGAPQTIDQVELYGTAVRWFVDVNPPDETPPMSWRTIAADAFGRATSTRDPGPVHVNVTFREPLVGVAGELPPHLTSPPSPPSPHTDHRESAGSVAQFSSVQRGVIIAGGQSFVAPEAVSALSARLGWPILADPTSGLRSDPAAVTASDALLRSTSFADAHAPELAIRVGRPPASKVVNEWVRRTRCPVVQVGGPGRIDPDHNVVATAAITELDSLTGAPQTPWLARWIRQNEIAEGVISAVLDDEISLSEPGVARAVADGLAVDQRLVVSSSMPVRDLENYGGRRARSFANRGANGIDGVISTGLGFAAAGFATTVLIGDLAAVHDSNAFVGARQRSLPLTVVVVDNDGGGIFSFLPQAAALERARFELLFGTPTGTDIVMLADAHGVATATVTTRDQLADLLAQPAAGLRLIRVPSTRDRNVEVHQVINAAVVAAIERQR